MNKIQVKITFVSMSEIEQTYHLFLNSLNDSIRAASGNPAALEEIRLELKASVALVENLIASSKFDKSL